MPQPENAAQAARAQVRRPKGATPRSRFRARSKYGAVRTTVDGRTFASKAEARRYSELRLLEKAGEISAVECQPVFILHVPVAIRSARVGSIIGVYCADFCYWRQGPQGAEWIVEDVKGVATPLYKWKKKHVEAEYNIVVQEIRRR